MIGAGFLFDFAFVILTWTLHAGVFSQSGVHAKARQDEAHHHKPDDEDGERKENLFHNRRWIHRTSLFAPAPYAAKLQI